MRLEIGIPRPVPDAYGPPAWCADIQIEVKFPPDEKIEEGLALEVEAIALGGRFGEISIWPPYCYQPTYPSKISKSGRSFPYRVPFTREMVQAIENRRAGKGPLDFDLQVSVRYHQLRTVQLTNSNGGVAMVPFESEVAGESIRWIVQRDPWNEFLKRLGWQESEIYEIKAGLVANDPNLAEALGVLRSAEAVVRSGGDSAVVLGKCYEAFETAAKYAVQGNDKKQGFAALLERAFGPDVEKSAQIDKVISALNGFAQFGRHSEYPRRHISPAEARFALKATLAVFELLGSNN
jgi:hypothetical protein